MEKNKALFFKQTSKAPKTSMAGSQVQKKWKKHLNHSWWKQTSIGSIPGAGNLYNFIFVNFQVEIPYSNKDL